VTSELHFIDLPEIAATAGNVSVGRSKKTCIKQDAAVSRYFSRQPDSQLGSTPEKSGIFFRKVSFFDKLHWQQNSADLS
jgi:hypothetical protein